MTRHEPSAVGRPTVVEIDLRALRANYRALNAFGNGAKVMAVVKVVGGTAVMIGMGFVLLLIARYKSRRPAEEPAQLT